MAIIFNPFDGQLAQHPDYSAEFAKLDSLYFLPTPTKTSTYSANIGEEVRCNTITTGSFTVTLPVASDGDSIKIVDVIGVSATTGFGVNNLIVETENTATIMGDSDLVINVGATKLVLMYNDSDTDWKIVDIDSPQFTNLEWSSILNKPPIDQALGALTPSGGIDTTIAVPLGYYNLDAVPISGKQIMGGYFPYDMIVSDVTLGLDTAPTGSSFTVDIKKNGTSIFSSAETRLTVLSGQTGSSTYQFTESLTLFEKGDLITFDTQVGATTPGSYPVVTISGIRGNINAIVVPLGSIDSNAVTTSDKALIGTSFPFNFYIEDIIITLQDPPLGSDFIVDIKKGGSLGSLTSIFSDSNNLLTFDKDTLESSYTLLNPSTTIIKGEVLTFAVTQTGISPDSGIYPVVTIIGREV